MNEVNEKIRGLGLCSGGLDSILAALVLREQGVEVKWVSFERDFHAFVKYRREGTLTFGSWIRSIATGRRDFAVFALDDPVPFIKSTFKFLENLVRPKLQSMIKLGQR